jgi:hypothetical protein
VLDCVVTIGLHYVTCMFHNVGSNSEIEYNAQMCFLVSSSLMALWMKESNDTFNIIIYLYIHSIFYPFIYFININGSCTLSHRVQ